MVCPILIPTFDGANKKIVYEGYSFLQHGRITYRCANHTVTKKEGGKVVATWKCHSKFNIFDNGLTQLLNHHCAKCIEISQKKVTEGTDAYFWHLAGKLDRVEKSHSDLEKFIKKVFPNYPDTTCYVQPKVPSTSSTAEVGITQIQPQHKRGMPMPTFLINDHNYLALQKDLCAKSSSASLGTPPPAKMTCLIQNLEGPASSSAPSNLPPIADLFFDKSYKSQATEEFHPNCQNVAKAGEQHPTVVIVANEPEEVDDEEAEKVVDVLIGTWKFCAKCEVFDEEGTHHQCICKCNSEEFCQVFGHPKK